MEIQIRIYKLIRPMYVVWFVVCTCEAYEGLAGLLLNYICMLKFSSDIIRLLQFVIL